MSKRFLLILAACVIGLGAIFWFSRDKSSAPGNSDNNSTAQLSNHVEGEGKSGVTLIEYGDFQCPVCAQFHPIVKNVLEKHKEDIKFQFRHYPLTQIHPNAFAASRAAEAAGLQGKFWEMYDVLFQQQSSWSNSTSPYAIFENYATQLGLDVAKFKQDYASSVVNDTINADMKAAKALGATGTPTFVLDGKKVEQNPSSQEAFDKLITDAIAAKKSN